MESSEVRKLEASVGGQFGFQSCWALAVWRGGGGLDVGQDSGVQTVQGLSPKPSTLNPKPSTLNF